MQTTRNTSAARSLAEVLVVSYMGAIALAAHLTGTHLLLFPELAALSHDVMTRPQGKWASQPGRIILTPTLTALSVSSSTRHRHYGAISIALIVLGESVHHQVTAIRNWPGTLRRRASDCVGRTKLDVSRGDLPWTDGSRSHFVDVAAPRPATPYTVRYSTNASWMIDELESAPHDRFWVIKLLAFVLLLGVPAQLTGLRFILFPPLIVMAYELFGHPEIPGWMERPALFPLVCVLTASLVWSLATCVDRTWLASC